MICEQEIGLEERPPSLSKGWLGGIDYLYCERQLVRSVSMARFERESRHK
jgi:hypothetical protein